MLIGNSADFLGWGQDARVKGDISGRACVPRSPACLTSGPGSSCSSPSSCAPTSPAKKAANSMRRAASAAVPSESYASMISAVRNTAAQIVTVMNSEKRSRLSASPTIGPDGTIYVNVHVGGILRSTDAGEHWTLLGGGGGSGGGVPPPVPVGSPVASVTLNE